MPIQRTILDQLYEQRAETMERLRKIAHEPSANYVGDEYIADSGVAAVKRARLIEKAFRYLDRIDEQIKAYEVTDMWDFENDTMDEDEPSLATLDAVLKGSLPSLELAAARVLFLKASSLEL